MDYYIFLIFLFDLVLSSENGMMNKCFRSGLINHQNIDSYANCSYLEGEIYISTNSFIAMHPEALNALKSIKSIKGKIRIDAYHPNLQNLSFLQNLETITGTSRTEYCIWIKNTSLKLLELRSLKEVHCKIFIYENNDLCNLLEPTGYIDRSYSYKSIIRNNKIDSECQCNEQCGVRGCWGRGPDQCISCRNYMRSSTCIQDCSSTFFDPQVDKCFNCSSLIASRICIRACPENNFLTNGDCKPCHDQCKGGCNDSGPNNCVACQHVKDGPDCVSFCPKEKYNFYGECRNCHQDCSAGCGGPDVGDCNIFKHDIVMNELICADGEYQLNEECHLCHDQCKEGCSDLGPDKCTTCKNVKDGENCVSSCPEGKYSFDGECRYCHQDCSAGCGGPNVSDCNIVEYDIEVELICADGEYQLNEECHLCHDQCKEGCIGAGPNNCKACQHVRDGEVCKAICPKDKYNYNGFCMTCHNSCFEGCTGPGFEYGVGECKGKQQDQSSNIFAFIALVIIPTFAVLLYRFCKHRMNTATKQESL